MVRSLKGRSRRSTNHQRNGELPQQTHDDWELPPDRELPPPPKIKNAALLKALNRIRTKTYNNGSTNERGPAIAGKLMKQGFSPEEAAAHLLTGDTGFEQCRDWAQNGRAGCAECACDGPGEGEAEWSMGY